MSPHSHDHSAVAPAEVLDPVCGMTISPDGAAGHVERAVDGHRREREDASLAQSRVGLVASGAGDGKEQRERLDARRAHRDDEGS